MEEEKLCFYCKCIGFHRPDCKADELVDTSHLEKSPTGMRSGLLTGYIVQNQTDGMEWWHKLRRKNGFLVLAKKDKAILEEIVLGHILKLPPKI
jgi:hypothetical protein